MLDLHNYPQPEMYLYDAQRATVLGEYGGIGLVLKDHIWEPNRNWGYVQFNSSKEVTDEYVKYADMLYQMIKRGFSAAVYTQTTDVEVEVNGLMTYDRKVIKLDEKRVKEINTRICNYRKGIYNLAFTKVQFGCAVICIVKLYFVNNNTHKNCYETIDYKAFHESVPMGGITGLCAGCCSLLFQNDGYRNGLFGRTPCIRFCRIGKGFMWFGTKDGLNRYDGLSFRIYKKENSGLGQELHNCALRGPEISGLVPMRSFIYDPVLDSFTAFDEASDNWQYHQGFRHHDWEVTRR